MGSEWRGYALCQYRAWNVAGGSRSSLEGTRGVPEGYWGISTFCNVLLFTFLLETQVQLWQNPRDCEPVRILKGYIGLSPFCLARFRSWTRGNSFQVFTLMMQILFLSSCTYLMFLNSFKLEFVEYQIYLPGTKSPKTAWQSMFKQVVILRFVLFAENLSECERSTTTRRQIDERWPLWSWGYLELRW